jgi:hypothetical protein
LQFIFCYDIRVGDVIEIEKKSVEVERELPGELE